MRVLLVSHTCQSRSEGLAKCDRLARHPKLELRVLVPDRWFHYGKWRAAETNTGDGYQVKIGDVALPWAGPAQFYLHWYPGLAETLLEFKPDIIDLWEEPWAMVSAHACWLRNRLLPNARVISETEQNIDKSLPPPFNWLRKYSLRNADFVVARNREAVDVVRNHGYAGPAKVVSNGVDSQLFRPMDRKSCRDALGFSGFVVGYVGRLVEEKGLLDILQALAKCPPEINLATIGAGPLAPVLVKEIERLSLGGRVRMLPAQPLEALPEFMNAIDCLAIPSHTTNRWKEQFGRVIIEAHACRTPVIGSDSGAIPEVVGNGGLIARERDPDSLAAAMVRFHADPAARTGFGAAGFEQAVSKYTWEAVADSMYSVYDTLCPARDSATLTPSAADNRAATAPSP